MFKCEDDGASSQKIRLLSSSPFKSLFYIFIKCALKLSDVKSVFRLLILSSSLVRFTPMLSLMRVKVVFRMSEYFGQSKRKCISSSILDSVHGVHSLFFLSVFVHLPVSIAKL